MRQEGADSGQGQGGGQAGDADHTGLVEHSIITVEGTTPICLLHYWLGKSRGQEADEEALTTRPHQTRNRSLKFPSCLGKKKEWVLAILRRLSAPKRNYSTRGLSPIIDGFKTLVGTYHFNTLDLVGDTGRYHWRRKRGKSQRLEPCLDCGSGKWSQSGSTLFLLLLDC